MKLIQVSDAKTHLSQPLDEVERGETILITRHGRTIARIASEIDKRRNEVAQAIESIQKRRKRMPSITVAELFSARGEGRKG
jgi:prevent-host-death family protein